MITIKNILILIFVEDQPELIIRIMQSFNAFGKELYYDYIMDNGIKTIKIKNKFRTINNFIYSNPFATLLPMFRFTMGIQPHADFYDIIFYPTSLISEPSIFQVNASFIENDMLSYAFEVYFTMHANAGGFQIQSVHIQGNPLGNPNPESLNNLFSNAIYREDTIILFEYYPDISDNLILQFYHLQDGYKDTIIVPYDFQIMEAAIEDYFINQKLPNSIKRGVLDGLIRDIYTNYQYAMNTFHLLKGKLENDYYTIFIARIILSTSDKILIWSQNTPLGESDLFLSDIRQVVHDDLIQLLDPNFVAGVPAIEDQLLDNETVGDIETDLMNLFKTEVDEQYDIIDL